MGGVVLNLEHEGWLEGGVTTACVTEEKTIRLHGIMGEQQATGSGSDEEVGAFQDRWSGVATFGRAIADQEASDVAFDEALVEIGEEVGEAHFGPTARAFE